jgi:hypothetical protein
MTAEAPTIDVPEVPAPAKSFLRRVFGAIASGFDWIFGFAAIIAGLAALSVIPLVNFLTLGYMLHASARVAATGKFRNGFIGVRKASRLGSFFLGGWLVFLPVRILSGLWKDALLIAPDSPKTKVWGAVVFVLTLLAGIQVIWASLRGGRLRHFLWPAPLRFVRWLSTQGKFETIRNAVVDYVFSLRLPFYFWLGARGFVGALIWLFVPVMILIAAGQLAPNKGGVILSFIGGAGLMFVASSLPFLQANFALESRFSALFALRAVREMFKRAPIALWFALLITLLFAIPLYLLKIELPPREIAWLPSVLFVIFIFPARLLTGWAVHRANRRNTPAHWFFRFTGRFAKIPVLFVYVLFVYLTQYLTWNGSFSLFEQHAFMVPAPLIGY